MLRSAPFDPEDEAILASLRPHEADRLRRKIGMAPWEVFRARLDARDNAIRKMAARFYAGMSARSAAAAIAADLARHAFITGRLISSPDPARMALIDAIRLSEGSIPGAAQTRRILAGVRTPIGGG